MATGARRSTAGVLGTRFYEQEDETDPDPRVEAMSDTADNRRPNLLFVFADQWRRHAVGFAGEDPVLTPRIDAFAEDALVVENAVSGCPVCSPYRAAMMTGRYPIANGVLTNCSPNQPSVGLAPDPCSFGNVLRTAGYATAYIGKWHLDRFDRSEGEWPYPDWNTYTPPGPRRQGFDYWYSYGCNHSHFDLCYWRDDPKPFVGKGWQPDHETDALIAYLEGRADDDGPFAAFLSYSTPHTIHRLEHLGQRHTGWKFDAPPEYEALYRERPLAARPNVPDDIAEYAFPGYFGAVTNIDDNFGRILASLRRLGLLDDTIVVLTADHGELLGSHGLWTKFYWYEESIGIPFLIRYPAAIAPGRSEAIVNHVDVMPTLLDLLGVPVPDAAQGESLRQAFTSGGEGPEFAYLEASRTPGKEAESWRGVRSRRYTYVERPGEDPLLYDNEADPYQIAPIPPADARFTAVAPHHREALVEQLRRLGDPSPLAKE